MHLHEIVKIDAAAFIRLELRMKPWASAADLKFLHQLPGDRLGTSSGTRNIEVTSALLFPKFVQRAPQRITNFGNRALVHET